VVPLQASGLNQQYGVWKLLVAACDGARSMIGNQDVEMMREGVLRSSRGNVCVDGIHVFGPAFLTAADIEVRLLKALTSPYQKIDKRILLAYICNHCKVVYVMPKYFGSYGNSSAGR